MKAHRSVPTVATTGALWVSGVVALPLIFGSLPPSLGSNVAWLGVAVGITVLLFALMPNLARLLADGLARLSNLLASPGSSSSAAFRSPQLAVVARLLVLAVELLIVQAVLRRPIGLVLGGERQVATVEAGIAAGALMVILPLLAWTYQTTRPMVQAATLRALDAALPTIGSAALVEPVTRGSHVAVPPTVRRPTAGDETVRAVDGDKTVVSPRVADDDQTAVSPPRANHPRAGGA